MKQEELKNAVSSENLFLRAHDSPGMRDCIELYCSFFEKNSTIVSVVDAIIVSKYDEAVSGPQASQPFARLTKQQAAGLMDSLWHAGVRPSEAGNKDEMSAIKAHLDDMRTIVAKKIGVDLALE